MASKTEETPQKEEMPEKEGPETLPESPLLDLSDAAVKKLIRSAKKRGYVTHDQINLVLPSEEVNSEQIEDVLAMFREMGVNFVETEEMSKKGEEPREEGEESSEEGEEPREEAEEEAESESGQLVEVQQKVPAKSEAKEPTERTDDPVRMYLREMGSVELLSREGEIAIAKRIEAGREAMIAGLCESPLTFQAIIIWRDELNEGKVFLRDIIDLEATYAGPDAKAMPAPVIGPDGQPIVPAPPAVPVPGALAQTPTPPTPPPSPPRLSRRRQLRTRKVTARGSLRLRPKAISTTTIWRTRSRLPPSRPSSSPRWWRPSTTSPTPTSGCAACRTRTSRTSCATIRSRPRRSAATRSSRTTSSAR
jgi:RNA polymerase primary sigma factor